MVKENGVGVNTRVKGKFTFRTAGVLFILSAAFELISLTSKVPFLGAVRGGAPAILYHLFYSALFLTMGIGLWKAASWGYRAVLAGTLLYTLDKILFLLDRKTIEASLLQIIGKYEEIFEAVDMGYFVGILRITTLTIILCWLGFALYTHFRRDYFLRGNSPEAPNQNLSARH